MSPRARRASIEVVEHSIKQEKNAIEKATKRAAVATKRAAALGNSKTSEVRPQVKKLKVPITSWLGICIEGDSVRLKIGNKLECLKYLADFTKSNPGSTMDLYIAHGLKVGNFVN